MTKPIYIALDPGGTTGYATFNNDGEPLEVTYLDLEKTRGRLKADFKEHIVVAVICESWRLFPEQAKNFYHSDMPTSRLIGWIEGACWANDVPLHMQAPAIKSVAYRWAQKKPLPKSNPMNHGMDAFVHGNYWLIKNGVKTLEE